MSHDSTRTGRMQDASPTDPQNAARQSLENLVRWVRTSSRWQLLIALSLVLVSVVGLCQMSGLAERLRPLPTPTTSPTEAPTATVPPTPTRTSTPAATATPTDTPVPVVLVGGDVAVTGTGTDELLLRAGPGLTQQTLRSCPDGTRLRVLAGPEEADGHTWWKVRTDGGEEGWVAADWLVPFAP